MEQRRTDTRERVTSGDVAVTSSALRGGGRKTSVARGAVASGGSEKRRFAWLGRWRESVWLPVVAKALGIFVGMLALAGVGASSLARGAGVPAGAAPDKATGPVAAGLGILGRIEPRGAASAAAGTPARASTSAAPPVASGATPAPSSAPADAGAAPSGGMTPDGKVILNRAGVDELCSLPGVGPKRAQAIVELRTKLGGRFKRMADLLRLKGIGPKSLRKIEAKAVLDAP